MKLCKIVLVALMLIVNLAIAQPSWADVNLTKSPDYAEVTQTLNDLIKAKDAPDQSSETLEQIQQQIAQLQFQKYILETAEDWAQCRNQTGQTLAVYATKPKQKSAQANTLYFLGDGQMTDDDWNCNGIYLPTGAKVAGLNSLEPQELGQPIALKIVEGTQLLATTNPDTGAVEFNIPPAKVYKAGEVNWSIPDLTQADITAQVPNAPIED